MWNLNKKYISIAQSYIIIKLFLSIHHVIFTVDYFKRRTDMFFILVPEILMEGSKKMETFTFFLLMVWHKTVQEQSRRSSILKQKI